MRDEVRHPVLLRSCALRSQNCCVSSVKPWCIEEEGVDRLRVHGGYRFLQPTFCLPRLHLCTVNTQTIASCTPSRGKSANYR